MIVARFQDLAHPSLDMRDSSAVYLVPERGAPQPEIIGFMRIPDQSDYAFV